jgi:hypothetical protein
MVERKRDRFAPRVRFPGRLRTLGSEPVPVSEPCPFWTCFAGMLEILVFGVAAVGATDARKAVHSCRVRRPMGLEGTARWSFQNTVVFWSVRRDGQLDRTTVSGTPEISCKAAICFRLRPLDPLV